MLKTKTRLTSKKFLLPVLIVLVVAAGGALYALNNRSDTSAPGGTNPINLEPATKEDAKRAEETKQQIVEQEKTQTAQSSQPTASKQTVKPVITYADQKGVGAYVPVFEDGGKCTATFSKGSAYFTKSVTAVKNVSTTTCPEMTVTDSDFSSKGAWTVTVSYESSVSNGKSDSRTIEVK